LLAGISCNGSIEASMPRIEGKIGTTKSPSNSPSDGICKGHDKNLIEFPSTHMSEGLKALIEQLVTWYPEAPRSQKTDCVMSFWFAELAIRDRISNANYFARSHRSTNIFHTRYDKSKQVNVNLTELASIRSGGGYDSFH
jgi:hypothetical protein